MSSTIIPSLKTAPSPFNKPIPASIFSHRLSLTLFLPNSVAHSTTNPYPTVVTTGTSLVSFVHLSWYIPAFPTSAVNKVLRIVNPKRRGFSSPPCDVKCIESLKSNTTLKAGTTIKIVVTEYTEA